MTTFLLQAVPGLLDPHFVKKIIEENKKIN